MSCNLVPPQAAYVWDLLHILNDDWRKCHDLRYELYEKYGYKHSLSYLHNTIAVLSRNDFVETKKGRGVRRTAERSIIYLIDIIKVLGVQYEYSTNKPSGRVQSALYSYLERFSLEV